MQFIQHYATLRYVQEIYFASVSNIDSVVAGTRNIPGSEAFILWLPGYKYRNCVATNIIALHDEIACMSHHLSFPTETCQPRTTNVLGYVLFLCPCPIVFFVFFPFAFCDA